jgi:O-antigen/teichoic acid export membrane protein
MKDLKKTLYLGLGLGVKLLAGLYAVKLCAHYLGPESFGVTGHLSSLLSVISLLAGAGVSVGITKVYAGSDFPIEQRPHWLKAARKLMLGSAALLALLLVLFSGWITEQLFSAGEQARWLLAGLLLSILPIGYASIWQGKINGYDRGDLYALSMVGGSALGLLGLWGLSSHWGGTGALLGMVWLLVSQALVMSWTGHRLGKGEFKQSDSIEPTNHADKIRFLLSYGALSIAAGAIIPLVYIAIRLLVQQHEGDRIFGLWQATLRISEAYSQLPMMLLSVVLFARFASTADAPLDKRQVEKTYLLMAALMVCIAAFVYLTKAYWIPIVFTAKFAEMEAFVPWQLAGDTLRILSYVGTTILAARGAVKICLIGEFFQGILLIIVTSLFIPFYAVKGFYYGYISSYAIYLAVVLGVVSIKRK